jgi:uncharacterized protein (TIGR02145 family)
VWHHYDNDKANCAMYGKLYYISSDIEQLERLCPSGWTIPTYAQWCTLMEAYGIFFDPEHNRFNRDDTVLMRKMWSDLSGGPFKPVLAGARNKDEWFDRSGELAQWVVRDDSAIQYTKGVRVVGIVVDSEVNAVDPSQVKGSFSVRLVRK